MTTDEQFNPGQGCKAPASGGWCVAGEDCLYACQFGGQSTSALLAQTQAALAASQADLSRALEHAGQQRGHKEAFLRQRGEAWVQLDRDRAELTRVERERGAMAMTIARLHGEVLTVQSERDYLRAQLDEQQAVLSADLTRALAELDAARQSARDARSWDVARQDLGVGCASCSQPIVRSQGFQPLADAKGFFAHVHCPDLKEPQTYWPTYPATGEPPAEWRLP